MDRAFRSYAAEFVGTFTLVFVGTAVATWQGMLGQGPAGWLGISLAFGGTLAVLVLVIGPVSGCHVNPAVTIPMAVVGRMKWELVPGYVVAQIAGGLVASVVLLALMRGVPDYELALHGLGANGNALGQSTASLFGWELVLTALFLFTILSSTAPARPAGFAALAIGGFLFLAHLVGVPQGDSSLNPARSIGPAVFQRGAALGVLWVFVVAPIIGGLAGLGLYKLVGEGE